MAGKFQTFIICIMTTVMLAVGGRAALADGTDGEKTVTVAFPEAVGINETYEDGTHGGIVYDWLVEIGKYTGWKYEFVTGDSSELLEEMMEEKYDLMGGMLYQEALTDYFCYPEYAMGSNYSLLIFREDDESIRDFDLTTLNGKSIGVLRKAESKIQRLEKFLALNNLTCTIQYYDETEDYEKCLENGETDLMLGNDIHLASGYNVAAKFPADPFYLVTAKNEPELCRELNGAMKRIYEADSNFAQELYDKYFPDKYINSLNFSEEDKAFIEQSPPIRVAMPENGFPFYSVKEGKPCGITVDVLEIVSRKTGLTFEYVPFENFEELFKAVKDGRADLIGLAMDDEDNAMSHGMALTKSYTSMDEVIIRNKQVTYPSEGLVPSLPNGRKAPEGVAPEDVLYFSSYRECLSAVNSGRADYTQIPSAFLEGMYVQDYFGNVMMMSVDNISTDLSFALPRPVNTELYSVLNKAVNNIREEEIDNVVSRNLVSAGESRITLETLFYANPVAAIGVCMSFVVLLAAVLLLTSRYKMKSRIMALKLEKAEENAREKTEFLSRMSHEIRTPMNAIIGLTNLALLSDDTPAPTRVKLEKIDDSAEFLLHLINDVLDMTKIGSSKMKVAHNSFDLEKLMRELQSMFELQASEKGILLTVEYAAQDHILMGDEMRIKQILVNLLSNACKFTHEGGNIEMSVREISRTPECARVRFSVKDNGEGIREEDLERIFQSFEQSEAGIRKTGGTGLGLSISRGLVELMGGKLKVESAVGTGSEFYFTLEFEISEEQAAEEEVLTDRTEEVSFEGVRFLLAEDNDLNAEIATSLLEMKGAVIERAENGEEAVRMFADHPAGYYRAVLMDIKMPVKDGLAATAEIRSLNRDDAGAIPIIAMTANTFSEDRESAARAGMNGFVPKPFDMRQLYGVLGKYLTK